jgi:Leucine-rich repeat (LRR) protein
VINISGNLLFSLPAEIGQLKNLKELDLHDNQLSTLPAEIGQLTNLTSLDISNNQLSELPAEIWQLKNLTRLWLSDNQLSELPAEIGQLTNLTELVLPYNELSTLPAEIGQLTELTVLILSDNQLSTLPAEIGQLKSLTELYLSRNKLSSLPAEILELDMEIKWEWGGAGEKGIFLADNPWERPPIEIIRRGKEEVRNYFRQIQKAGKDYLYEAKLLIVGEPGAGKTTLARKIEDEDYQLREDEESTKGIYVVEWHFSMYGGQDFRVNIWDFGGQEIYHSTHQFFLTKRSLYALVADDRKEDTDFNYWLNVVDLLSDESPILIVKNEKQDRHREINETALRGQFGNIRGFIATNLATNRGLVDLKKR